MASFAATSSTSLSRQMAIAAKPVKCFSQGRSNLSFKLRPLPTKRFSVSCAAKPETVEKVCKVVKEQLSLEADQKVTGASAFADLGADSLDTVEVVMALEEAFGIEMPEEKAQYATTIEKAAEIIEEVLASKP